MDFLVFFLGYIGIFSVLAVFVIFSSFSQSLSSIAEKLKERILNVVYAVVPGIAIRCILGSIYYVFNTRNHVMQLVFGGLVMGGNIIFMLDILPLLYIFEPEKNHLFLPMVLLFSNAVAFHISCASDPGRVTSANVAMLASLYKADGVLYKAGVDCITCNIIKPPRSKHCRICNCCVHRFDHHCIWTNNCVGGGNVRFFLVFLLTLMGMIVNGAVTSTRAIVLMVDHLKMLESGYIDPQTGQVFPVTVSVLIQHLFMQYPRSIFLITSLAMLTLLLGLFTLYHLFLAASNQTTNERYKIASLPINNNNSSINQSASNDNNSRCVQRENQTFSTCNMQQRQCKGNDKSQHSYLKVKNSRKKTSKGETSNNNGTSSNKLFGDSKVTNNHLTTDKFYVHNVVMPDVSTLYNRGLFLNLKEVIFPWSGMSSIKQSKMNIFVQNVGVKKA